MGSTATRIAAAASIATLIATTSAAHADPGRGSIDWERLLVDIDAFARRGASGVATKESATAKSATPSTRPSVAIPDPPPMIETAGNAWFGVEPRVAIVARDWGSAFRLAGDRLTLSDAMRLSKSTRMVLTRVRLSATRIAPFAQFGVGQWRTDPNILPLMPRSTEVAAQAGGGIEIRLWPGCHLAAEMSATMLVRDAREPNDLPQTRLWSTMIASRFVF